MFLQMEVFDYLKQELFFTVCVLCYNSDFPGDR